MKLKLSIGALPLVTALLFGAGWAQETPNSQSQPDASAKRATGSQKEKHLSGSLVDIGCMAKTLGADMNASPTPDSATGFPHLMGWGAEPPPPGQVAGQGVPGSMQNPRPRTTDPGYPPDHQMPTGDDQQAQMARAAKVESAARQCVASPLAETLGLAMSDGQVLQFNPDGTAKAKEALKGADVEAGKKIKAKVVGTMEDKTTVNVASIEIKGKGKKGSANSGG